MKNFIVAAVLALVLAASPAMATEKSRAALQADYLTYKLRYYDPNSIYSNLYNTADSCFNLTTDDIDDITGGALDGQVIGGVTPAAATVTTLTATTGVNTSGITVSTALTGNPLVQGTKATVTAAQINADTVDTILAGTSGKSIIPMGLTVQASGTATTATSVTIKCESGNVLSTFPIGLLTDDVPTGPMVSAGPGDINPTNGIGLVEGCAAGDGIQASVDGSALAGTTHLFVTIPYIVQ